MSNRPPTSVLLPTIAPTDALGEIVDQLGPQDELLVICDRETDPVASHVVDAPDAVRLVVAGEPEGCSGKANAIAAGMEAARHERLVWTDDDFHHPDDWLEQLREAYDRRGPTTELPFFVGQDPLSVLLEPVYVLGGTAGLYADEIAWAGSVIFERGDLPDEEAFLRDLRRTVSDDGLLTERVDVTPVKRVRRVETGGSIREALENHVRFTKILAVHGSGKIGASAVVATVVAIASLLFPVPGFVGLTAAGAGLYATFRLRRWTFLLSYPALVLSVPLVAFALFRRTFVWGGRRYRWADKFDVEIVDRG